LRTLFYYLHKKRDCTSNIVDAVSCVENEYVLSQVVLKIVGDFVVEMYGIRAIDIMFGTGVGEVIHAVDIVLYALSDETQRVLPNHYGVNCALAD
jgi:hypothetical protein